MAEGVAELLRAQLPLLLELGGVEFLFLNLLLHGGLVGGDHVYPAGGEHLERLGEAVGGDDFGLVKAVVEQQLLAHIGSHRPDIERLGIVELGDVDLVLGQPDQHDFGVTDGAGPLEQRIARLGAGGGEEHRIGFLGQQVVATGPGHDGDGLLRGVGLLPYQLEQLDRKAGRIARFVGVVIGFVIFGQVVKLGQLGAGVGEGTHKQCGQSNPWFHFFHPAQGNIYAQL